MDGDPKVESELDPFSRVLPLPYRVAIILVCGNKIPVPGLRSGDADLVQEYGHGVSIYITCTSSRLMFLLSYATPPG